MGNFIRCVLLSATLFVALLATQSAWAQSPSPSPSPTPLEECVECYPPTPTPSPSPTPTPSASPSPTPSPTSTPRASEQTNNTTPVTGSGSSVGSIHDLAGQRVNQMITNRVLGNVLLGVTLAEITTPGVEPVLDDAQIGRILNTIVDNL